MSLELLRKMSVPASMTETRDALITSLSTNNHQSARLALYQLLDAIKHPSATNMAFMMFKHRDLTLKDIADRLNILTPAHKKLLFSAEAVEVTEQLLDTSLAFNTLALKIQESQYQKLLSQRKAKGFTHFLGDLKDKKYNKQRPTWNLTNGLLNVKTEFFNDPKTISEIHNFLGQQDVLGGKPWYEKPEPSSDKALFDVGFKTLGKKINRAVDPLFILKGRNGSLKVLCGRRFDGSLALPGGMNESTVMQTCLDELLEECFSGNLFSKESQTANLLDKHDGVTVTIQQIIKKRYLEILHTTKKPTPNSDGYAKAAAYIEEERTLASKLKSMLPPNELALSSSRYIQEVIAAIRKSDIDKGKIEPLVAHIKCDIYKQCLPEQYGKFEKLITSKVHKEPLVMNKSDPRNTDLGAMFTEPLEAVLDEEKLTSTLKEDCALEFGAGDDLGDVAYRPIEEFSRNAYSDHTSLLVHAINRGIQRGEIELTPTVKQQLLSIASDYSHQDSTELFSTTAQTTLLRA